MKKIGIVIPTYNERENLPSLVEKIFALTVLHLRVYVVDDSSPDGTGETAENLAQQYPITVIHRTKKEGLGRAYVSAFKTILAENECDYIIQMDADLSHDPSVIPEMLRHMDTYDIVVGSRYVAGGTVRNWHILRLLLSMFGNTYARTILRMRERDITSGFKCYRQDILKELIRNSFDSVGYNFQIEILYRAHKNKYKILEIPIVFTERKTGASKIDPYIIIESFYKVLLLCLRDMFK